MGLLKIYTAVCMGMAPHTGQMEAEQTAKGAYGCVLSYTNLEGQEYHRELMQAYENSSYNRLALLAAIHALRSVTRPCRIELYAPAKYLTDAFNQNWIDKWLKNSWYRESSGPVRNVDLWEELLACMKPHELRFIWYSDRDGDSEEPLVRCRSLSECALAETALTDTGSGAAC